MVKPLALGSLLLTGCVCWATIKDEEPEVGVMRIGLTSAKIVTFDEVAGRMLRNRDPEDEKRLDRLREHFAARAMEKHQQAWATIREKYSDERIEAVYRKLVSEYPFTWYQFWTNECYRPELMEEQHVRYFHDHYGQMLGPEFVTGLPGFERPNPEMVELTLALTDGALLPEPVKVLPNGKTREEVLARVIPTVIEPEEPPVAAAPAVAEASSAECGSLLSRILDRLPFRRK